MTDLRKIEEMQKQIEEQIYYIQELKYAIYEVKGVSYDKESVQTSKNGDPMLCKLVRIEEEEMKLCQMQMRLTKYKVKMINRIHAMGVSDLQKLLYVIYIEGHTLSEAGDIMNWSEEYTKKQHRKAILKFNEISV